MPAVPTSQSILILSALPKQGLLDIPFDIIPIKHQQLIGDSYKDTPRARDSLGWGPSAPQNYRWMQRFYLMQHRTSPALCLGSVRDGGDPASPGLVLGASRGNCQDPGSMDFMGARVGCQG